MQQQVRVQVDQAREQRRLAELHDADAFGRGAAVVRRDLLDAAVRARARAVAPDVVRRRTSGPRGSRSRPRPRFRLLRNARAAGGERREVTSDDLMCRTLTAGFSRLDVSG